AHPDPRRRNPPSLRSAVELRHRKILLRLAENLVRLAQFAILPFKGLHLLGHLGRDAGALAAVDFGLLDPVVQRLRGAADLRRNRHDRLPARRVLTSLSRTSRTARSRTSGENLFVVLLMMLHPTQELEPPANPARFSVSKRSSTVICPGNSPKADHALRLKPDHPMGSGHSEPMTRRQMAFEHPCPRESYL